MRPTRDPINRYRLPEKIWEGWSPDAQRAFNRAYSLLRAEPGLFQHTGAATVPRAHWAVTAWNVAWLVADEVNADAVSVRMAEGLRAAG